jgi:hypothetical protein
MDSIDRQAAGLPLLASTATDYAMTLSMSASTRTVARITEYGASISVFSCPTMDLDPAGAAGCDDNMGVSLTEPGQVSKN